MRQPGCPPLRVRVALVAACYVLVWLGGVSHHAGRCAGTPQTHCTLCACLTTIPLTVDRAIPTPALRDAGAAGVFVPLLFPLAAGADGVTRAPPSAEILPSN